MLRTRLIIVAFALLFSSAPVGASGQQTPTDFTFGIVPQQAASKIARQWSPILRYLADKSGIALKLKTAPDIPQFEERLAAAEYDFAYMNPYHYVVFSRAPGYIAFAKQKNAPIVGLLVTNKAHPIQNLSELNGATLAFPSPAAFAASILPQAYLRQQGITFTSTYVSSHDSVYQNVARGFVPAGGGIDRTLNAIEPSLREQLEVLWRSPEYTSHAFAAHPRVPQESVKKLLNAMLAMEQDPEGRALLAEIQFEGFAAASDSEWNDIRALHIEVISSGGNH